MGVVHDTKENYTNALDDLQKVLNIQQKYHDRNHPDIAVAYNNIGLVHKYLDYFDLALKNFEQTFLSDTLIETLLYLTIEIE